MLVLLHRKWKQKHHKQKLQEAEAKLSFPYYCVLLKLACGPIQMRQGVTVTNEVDEMLPFLAFWELAVMQCGVSVFLPPPPLLLQAYSGLSIGVSWCALALLVSPSRQLMLIKTCWMKSAIQHVAIHSVHKSWVLALQDQWLCWHHGRGGLPPIRAEQARMHFSSHSSTALHHRTSISLLV